MMQARAARRARAALAREDVNVFVPYVLRDDESGREVRQTAYHEEWHRLADANARMAIWSFVEAGKTIQLGVGRTLWELGNDPTLRFAVVGGTQDQANKTTALVGKHIAANERLHEVFPKLRHARKVWSSTSFTVDRPGATRDPSVQAFGVGGAVLGSRLDRLLIDDALTHAWTRTPYRRGELLAWIESTLLNRMTRRGRVIMVGNAWHPDDAMHVLAARPGWAGYKYPVMDDHGVPLWPEHWSTARIEAARGEMGPLEFARKMMCVARSDAESRFKREWIDVCMRRGRGMRMATRLVHIPGGYRVITGVDLGVQRKANSDQTVLFTIAVHPDGTREVLWVDAGRWSAPEIMQRVLETYRRYQGIVYVENNGAQDFLLQLLGSSTDVPVVPFTTTGQAKHSVEFGLESMGAELAAGKWIIPSGDSGTDLHPEVAAWIEEMLYYDPTSHTGDRLMASWIAREGARRGQSSVGVNVIDLMRR